VDITLRRMVVRREDKVRRAIVGEWEEMCSELCCVGIELCRQTSLTPAHLEIISCISWSDALAGHRQ